MAVAVSRISEAVNSVRPATRATAIQPARGLAATGAYGEFRAKDQTRARRLIKRLRDQAAQSVCVGPRGAHPYFRGRVDEFKIVKESFHPHAIKHGQLAGGRKPDPVRVVARVALRVAADDSRGCVA